MKVPFLTLQSPDQELNKEISLEVEKILNAAAYIGGAAVSSFENDFAQFCGAKKAVGVANGTDALILALRALGIGPGDEVILPTFTFIATAEAVSLVGAKVKFADVDPETYCLLPEEISRLSSPKTKAVIPVHLFGQPAEMDKILALAKEKKLSVIADAAQAHGSVFDGKPLGQWGDLVCFSFYPTKNLNAAGDAGAVVSNDPALIEKVARLANHGRSEQYYHVEVGQNSRLDAIQAVVLSARLKRLKEWNKTRQRYASIYDAALKNHPSVQAPFIHSKAESVYHLYSVHSEERDELKDFLMKNEIGCGVYYPLPVHLQPAYANAGGKKGDFPNAEKASASILSLPMHPFLSEEQIKYAAQKISEFR